MAIQGLIGTGDYVGTTGLMTLADQTGGGERPLNWREGILMRFPNGHAPLTALTAAMKKKVTDDPVFNWWEREVSDIRVNTTTTIPMDPTQDVTLQLDIVDGTFGGAAQVKVGDMLYIEATGEVVRCIAADPAGDTIDVSRDWGGLGTIPAVTPGAGVNSNLVIIGSAYEEAADSPQSVRYRPTKVTNNTQIFRDSLKASRTAMHTRLRTVDEIRDAKTQTLLYHSMRMEYGFIFGVQREIVGGGGEPLRTTGGVIEFINSAGGVVDLTPATNAAGSRWYQLEDQILEAFRFGSQEKMCFLGNRAMLAIQRMIRKAASSSMELTPAQKEFGMDVRRLFTSSGTLVLKTHPLFNQIQSAIDPVEGINPASGTGFTGFDTWMLILDMANITYRPLRNSDTQYLPDRQGNGIDGLTSEYLTECGLEVNHGKTHRLLKGIFDAENEPDPIVQGVE